MKARPVHSRGGAGGPKYAPSETKRHLGRSAELPIPVARLPRRVRHYLSPLGQQVWLEGEIQDIRWARTGDVRFTLRGDQVQLECVVWREDAKRLSGRFRPLRYSADPDAAPATQAGDLVVVCGRLSLDNTRVAVRFGVTDVRRTGVAHAEVERDRVRRALERDGLLSPSRKRRIPRVPRLIALITSSGSAAEADVLAAARVRHPAVRIEIIPALVQGTAAAQSIVDALERVGKLVHCDVVLLCRGGGSASELAPFDDEGVARAIVRCPAPVVTGIGHETDTTLADYVADLRALTPTAAAVAAVPLRVDLEAELASLDGRLRDALLRSLGRERSRVQRAGNGIGQAIALRTERARRSLDRFDAQLHAAPAQRMAAARRVADQLGRDLRMQFERSIEQCRARRDLLAAQLAALGPTAILARGYAIPRGSGGAVLGRAAAFARGSTFVLTLADGEVEARVLNAAPNAAHADHDENSQGG